ncbi:hypothetical protein [Geitlerinema sp. PCC 9228]|uniref:hypothetical protein n=1 Tax=Geitlerinema sp. PCC 9228 TaxID=111611 RepID=UPI0011149FB8|nr:hypothetical protein [Geitlerinema sp. PCC 9228]
MASSVAIALLSSILIVGERWAECDRYPTRSLFLLLHSKNLLFMRSLQLLLLFLLTGTAGAGKVSSSPTRVAASWFIQQVET